MSDASEESPEDEDIGGGRARGSSKTLVTPRLVLRIPEMADAPDLVPLANNRRIAEQTRRMPHPYTLDDARAFISAVREERNGRETAFVITRETDGALLGAVGYAAMEDGDVEIGYWLGEVFWGQGYATEAAQALIDHAFSETDLSRLFGRCRTANTASRRVLEKCGFQYAGAGMCECRVLKGPVPSEDFVLERSVWQSLKRWAAV